MKNKIFFSEWTDYELENKNVCYCECHFHPGTYPTNENDPCYTCGHINEYGYFPHRLNKDGWVEYWRSDKVDTYATR